MKRFYRIGEKLSAIAICGNDIKQYSIVIHSNRNLAAPTDAPDWIIKAANVMQTYIYKLTDTFIPIYYDIYPVPTPKEILIGGTVKEYDCYKDEKFADDEYAFKTVDGNVVINGGLQCCMRASSQRTAEHLPDREEEHNPQQKQNLQAQPAW